MRLEVAASLRESGKQLEGERTSFGLLMEVPASMRSLVCFTFPSDIAFSSGVNPS